MGQNTGTPYVLKWFFSDSLMIIFFLWDSSCGEFISLYKKSPGNSHCCKNPNRRFLVFKKSDPPIHVRWSGSQEQATSSLHLVSKNKNHPNTEKKNKNNLKILQESNRNRFVPHCHGFWFRSTDSSQALKRLVLQRPGHPPKNERPGSKCRASWGLVQWGLPCLTIA